MVVSTVEPQNAAEGEDKHTSLSEKAYRLLRSEILRGSIPPEGKLKTEALQRRFALSSSPLREALNRLRAEGLVHSDDHRGFRVASMSVQDLRDITTFRLTLEPIALEQSVMQGDDEWEAAVISAHHRLERAHNREAHTSDQWTVLHKAFHMALILKCPSSRMITTCSALFDLAERYRRFSATHRETPRDIAAEHRQLMGAALDHDAEAAGRLLREHIATTAANVIAHYPSRSSEVQG